MSLPAAVFADKGLGGIEEDEKSAGYKNKTFFTFSAYSCLLSHYRN
jgi:hypothetical protein